MKKILFLILILTVANSGLFAQQKQKQTKTAEERAEKMYAKMDELLQLQEGQKLKIKDIILVREQARDIDRKALAGDKEALKKITKARNNEREQNFKANLTPEQYAKLVEYREQKKQKRQEQKSSEQPTEESTEENDGL